MNTHQTTERLLREAISTYCSPERPSMSSCHRRLSARIWEENARRLDQGLPLLEIPSPGRLRRAILSLDAWTVHAARHGRASARARFVRLGDLP